MKIHEYQAKAILAHGVPVPRGEMASTAAERRRIAALGGPVSSSRRRSTPAAAARAAASRWRRSADEAEKLAKQILGMQLVTHQTGPEGRRSVARPRRGGPQIARELYLGMLIDRLAQRRPDGELGGAAVDIEEVASKTPT